jgi:hypothetical protein
MSTTFTRALLRWLARGLALGLVLGLAACGGGGSGNAAAPAANFPASAASLTDANVATISVESGPGNNVNIPYVTVTVCSPGGILGSSNCKAIDHVLLDTGSTGLRLFANVVNATPALVLPAHKIGTSSTITECAQFLNSQAWGAIKVADVVIGENTGAKRAASVPVQLMDTNFPTALGQSNLCGSSPLMAQSASTSANWDLLSANGILGVSLFVNDGQKYFNCTPTGNKTCLISPQPAASLQVQNPVFLFSGDNNGVVVQLPAVAAAGATSARGYLIFGVGTQSNNGLGAAHVVPVNAFSGFFTTTYKGKTLAKSFMDSGSNGLFFNDASLSTACNTAAAGFYCPPATQDLSASIQLASASVLVNFSIANADQLFKASNYAFNNMGGTLDNSSFDWGLPFFFGRSVYTVIEGTTVGTVNGPFYAFTN